MSYRETSLTEGEIYHVYNRGVEKRIIFENAEDYERFLNNLKILNTEDVVGSIFEFNKNKLDLPEQTEKLVNIIAYSLSPNHYHLILEQLKEGGIAKFMHKVGMGYAKYFNHKYQRVGTLFQGTFKSIHISTNEYLMYIISYVNLNNKIHTKKETDLKYSSWTEYTSDTVTNDKRLCITKIILDQFKDKNDYKKSALELLPELTRQKSEKREIKEKELRFKQIWLEI